LSGSIENAGNGACFKMTHFDAAENFIQINGIVNFSLQERAGFWAHSRRFGPSLRGATAHVLKPCRPGNP
jgi:hypothetical protein